GRRSSRTGSCTCPSSTGSAPTSWSTATPRWCAGPRASRGPPSWPPTFGPAPRWCSPAWWPKAPPRSAGSTTSTVATRGSKSGSTLSAPGCRGIMAPVPERQTLTFALPKGRILDQATPLLAAAGIDIAAALDEAGRKLLFDLPGSSSLAWRILLVKPIDVPTYVEHGIADFGIAGLDTLREQGRDLYEPVDLGIGRCRLVVAEPCDQPEHLRGLRRGMTVRVATKYPACALFHYRSKGIQP